MLAKAHIETECPAPQVVVVRRALTTPAPQRAENLSAPLPPWKRAGFVATAGILFGLGAAISFGPIHRPAQTRQHWVRVEDNTNQKPAPPVVSVEPLLLEQAATSNPDTAEVERLKTRNRRLEALVEVLKKRAHERTQP